MGGWDERGDGAVDSDVGRANALLNGERENERFETSNELISIYWEPMEAANLFGI